LAALEAKGLVKDSQAGLKILGQGSLQKTLTVRANRFSQAAREASEKAGGKVEAIADKELKLPARGQGARNRLAKERAARRLAKKAAK